MEDGSLSQLFSFLLAIHNNSTPEVLKEGSTQYIKTDQGFARISYRGGKWLYYPPGSKIATHEISFSIGVSKENIQKQSPTQETPKTQDKIQQTTPPTTKKFAISYHGISFSVSQGNIPEKKITKQAQQMTQQMQSYEIIEDERIKRLKEIAPLSSERG